MLMLLFIGALLLLLAPRPAKGVNMTHSQSKSHSVSRSASYSSGFCNSSSIAYFPSTMPPYGTSYTQPLWPTRLEISLSGNSYGNNPFGSVGVYVYYNYSYFHERNPGKVKKCNIAPDVSDVPYITFIESWHEFSPVLYNIEQECQQVCVFWFLMRLTCPMSAASGKYYLKIQGVGEVEIVLNVCRNEGSDYAFDCDAIPSQCRTTSAFMYQDKPKNSGLSEADKVGISFGVICGSMLVVIIVLAVFYDRLARFVAQIKQRQGGLAA